MHSDIAGSIKVIGLKTDSSKARGRAVVVGEIPCGLCGSGALQRTDTERFGDFLHGLWRSRLVVCQRMGQQDRMNFSVRQVKAAAR